MPTCLLGLCSQLLVWQCGHCRPLHQGLTEVVDAGVAPMELTPGLFVHRVPKEAEKEEQATAKKAVTREQSQGNGLWQSLATQPEVPNWATARQVPMQQFTAKDCRARPPLRTGLLTTRAPLHSLQLFCRHLSETETRLMENKTPCSKH